MTTAEEQARLRLARSLLVDGRVTVMGVYPKGVDADVVDGEAVLRCRRRASDWSCPCSTTDGDEECAHLLAVQMVVGDWLPAQAGPSVVRGADVVSGWEEWGWVVRLLQTAAGVYDKTHAGDLRAFEAVRVLLEQLDDEAVRGVAIHLALAPMRIGAVVLAKESLDYLSMLHSLDEPPPVDPPASPDAGPS